MSINISGLDKVELLKKLWERSKPAVFFTMYGNKNYNILSHSIMFGHTIMMLFYYIL